MGAKVVVTGGDGYIGSKLTNVLANANFSVLSLVRGECSNTFDKNIACKSIGDLSNSIDWSIFLSGVDCVIHLAARVHILKESSSSPLGDFMEINCDATLRLASDAANAGVRKFIYMSSIGVLGSSNLNKKPFNNTSKYNPRDMYSISKMEAEIGLRKVSELTDMEIVIIRPPLVYGANAPGNFYRLLRLVDSGAPLPLGGMNAKKSMISLDNLCDFIIRTVKTPLPKFNTLVVSDGSEWSTSELITLIADYMGKRSYLFSVSVPILSFFASLIGKKEEIHKLSTPLQVDVTKTAKLLNWQPGQSPEDGLREVIRYYLASRK